MEEGRSLVEEAQEELIAERDKLRAEVKDNGRHIADLYETQRRMTEDRDGWRRQSEHQTIRIGYLQGQLEQAVQFLEQIDDIVESDAFKDVFMLAHVHGAPYGGKLIPMAEIRKLCAEVQDVPLNQYMRNRTDQQYLRSWRSKKKVSSKERSCEKR